MNTLIYGLGRSGRAVAQYLHSLGWQAEYLDAKPTPEDLNVMQELGFAAGSIRKTYQQVIAAPGVAIDHPDLQVLQQHGAKIIGEVELGFLTSSVPTIGITGTAGKGSTTTLIAQILRFLGKNAIACGNIDPPLVSVIGQAEIAVVELSSFQLERIHDYCPQVAIITNLDIDHLDRHKTVQAYHAAKWNITRNQSSQHTLIVPENIDASGKTQAQILKFPTHPQQIITRAGKSLLAVAQLPQGIHPANAQAAVYAVEVFLGDVAAESLAAALRTVQPVSGRFECVAQHNNTDFIVDSIATRSIAVKAALENARAPIAWIVGGVDKGADLPLLRDVVQRKVKHIVAIGQDGAYFASGFDVPHTVVSPQNGYDDMKTAIQYAAEQLPEGGTVLLAPLGTSFDQFKDYKDREKAFREGVLWYLT